MLLPSNARSPKLATLSGASGDADHALHSANGLKRLRKAHSGREVHLGSLLCPYVLVLRGSAALAVPLEQRDPERQLQALGHLYLGQAGVGLAT